MVLQVYELPLQDDGSPSKQLGYNRLPAPVHPYVLRISIAAGSAASNQGVLYTSYPLDGSAFDRARFHQKRLPSDLSKPIELDLLIERAGVYEFYIEHENDKGHRVQSDKCYFNVDPILALPKRTPILDAHTQDVVPLAKGGGQVQPGTSVALPTDGLVLQSVIGKWMGKLTDWRPHLENVRDRGYNMLHFTPLQQRGASNSPYSIYDQLSFADDLFEDQNNAKLSNEEKEKIVAQTLRQIKSDLGMLSLTDVVWNHTAYNSDWLLDHPDAGYNGLNSPHLESAIELDRALYKFSCDLASLGLPTDIQNQSDLSAVLAALKDQVLPDLKLWQYYVSDVAAEKEKLAQAWAQPDSTNSSKLPSLEGKSHAEALAVFEQECLPENWRQLGARYHVQVDAPKAAALLRTMVGNDDPDAAVQKLGKFLDDLNVDQYKLFESDVQAILDNTRSRIQYQRIDAHGPRLGAATPNNPLVDRFFTELPVNERTKKHDPKAMALANNGWIWNADPLQDFASAASRAYTRREVIAWGDCVKLRYGSGPEDSPFLWEHMKAYTVQSAKLFQGFRIDNCHSTPIHVGEKLLDAARAANPNLYVCAELFTGSEEMDVYFVKRLGLNSLIREAMNGGDPKDQSRLLYLYGLGKPIGSMDGACLAETNTITLNGKEQACLISPLTGSSPHALMMDCTHDNEAPNSKRTPQDAMPTGALVTFAYAAIGSTKGFDDFYGKLLDVVQEARHYEIYKNPEHPHSLGKVKRVLNHLHTEMALAGFAEGHWHQEGDYIFSHRVHPQTHQGYLVIAHTAFYEKGNGRGDISPIILRGQKAKFIFGNTPVVNSREVPQDPKILKGLDVDVKEIPPIPIQQKSDAEGSYVQIEVPQEFPPGSIALLATSGDSMPEDLDVFCSKDAEKAFASLDMIDLNVVLYRADGEERDLTGGQDGVYDIKGLGALKYCGLEGWMHPLRHVMRYNDLGHPLCAHLREGTWACDYVYQRLEKQTATFPHLAEPAAWLKERFLAVEKSVPAFLRPRYFAMIVNSAYKAARDRALSLCSPFVQEGHQFTHDLALTAVQMLGQVKSASIDPVKDLPSLAAGLPHFAAGWARCWGRDVCISIRGLLLVTGQIEAGRQHLLAFATTLKHGLIPNLLDSIRTPRYNSRDSPWWFAQNVQDYVNISEEGEAFLNVPVKRRFPANDEWVPYDDPKAYSWESTVAEVLQEMLQRHASGIHFREYNAGSQLDMQMSDPGFNIDIEVDWNTGLIMGGNEWNCGTWMDKMGESTKAGNKGYPGTPRDGAPVEITGLLKSTLRWYADLSARGKIPFKGVTVMRNGKETLITYKEWNDLLQANFEKHYYIPTDPKEDSKYAVNSKIINRRGIYKDVVGSGSPREFSDYQLRANFPVAMSVAPELFEPEHALQAIQTYIDALWGPLGVATLDPSDAQYRPYYDNANDTDDFAVAKGRNYHQGPEWGWPAGYLLRALLHFDLIAGKGKKNSEYTLHRIHSLLAARRDYIRTDVWAGLPELTNKNGDHCHDSCDTQAWSSSTILDVLYDIYVAGQKKK